jgi:hypothetical protein
MTRPRTSSRAIVVRMVGMAFAIVVATIVILALSALSGCEGDPPSCPPPIGCAR